MARASAVIIKKGNILLIHRRKNGEEYWSFPGGGIEDGETGKEAITREIKEETGLTTLKTEFCFSYQNKQGLNSFFKCKVSGGKPVLGGEEALINSKDNWYKPKWVDLKAVDKITIYPKEGRELLKNL